jgi:hypothetical protein
MQEANHGLTPPLVEAMPRHIGQAFPWSRTVVVGGNRVVTGTAPITQCRLVYDHRLPWSKDRERRMDARHRPASSTSSGKALGRGIVRTEGVVPSEAGKVNPVREPSVTGEP